MTSAPPTPQGIKSRARRLWNNHAATVLGMSFLITLYLALNHNRTTDATDFATYALVPLAPGFILWALTGNLTYFGWGCACYLLFDTFFDVPGWTEFLTVIAGLPAAISIAIRRTKGWTCRTTLRTILLKAANWIHVDLPTATTTPLNPKTDRANTDGENLVMILAWTAAVTISLAMVPVFLDIGSAILEAIAQEQTP